jgi:cobaltochelatase CobT
VKFERDLELFRGDKSGSVLFLIDNSGSLRGKPISYLTAWSLLITEIFDDAGFKTETMGFTTRAWKGGQSREKWLADGRPPYPGRLNDLRYIIYKDFSQTFIETVQNYGVMLREGILKENIDGEALLFARDRLLEQDSDIKLLIVLSDGAPVDDSTLSVNGPKFLENHLISAIREVSSSAIELMAVGIDTDVKQYYGSSGISSTPERLGIDIMNIVRHRLGIGAKRKVAAKK